MSYPLLDIERGTQVTSGIKTDECSLNVWEETLANHTFYHLILHQPYPLQHPHNQQTQENNCYHHS